MKLIVANTYLRMSECQIPGFDWLLREMKYGQELEVA